MQGFPESRLPKFLPEDSARILGAYDFLGVNSYTGGLARPIQTKNKVPSYYADKDAQTFHDERLYRYAIC